MNSNGGVMKPTYDEMMEQFYEDIQNKPKNIVELNESSSLATGLCAPTKDDEISIQERPAIEVPKSTASKNVTRRRSGSSSKKLFKGTHISSEDKSPEIKIGTQTKPKGDRLQTKPKGDRTQTKPKGDRLQTKPKEDTIQTKPKGDRVQTKPKDICAIELNNMVMEAKSARDSSWYDVGTYLNHRVTGGGEIEARVRFAGFDSSHDEWVNVEKAIRQRSIPLQDAECHLVEVGDLVLCFRQTGDFDLYFDAHVTKIERNLHDIQGCRCIFQVCYDHDNYEEMVGLNKLCRRPS